MSVDDRYKYCQCYYVKKPYQYCHDFEQCKDENCIEEVYKKCREWCVNESVGWTFSPICYDMCEMLRNHFKKSNDMC